MNIEEIFLFQSSAFLNDLNVNPYRILFEELDTIKLYYFQNFQIDDIEYFKLVIFKIIF